jgi:hypothetical protein
VGWRVESNLVEGLGGGRAYLEKGLIDLEECLFVVNEEIQNDKAVLRCEVLCPHLPPGQLPQLVEAFLELPSLLVTYHLVADAGNGILSLLSGD